MTCEECLAAVTTASLQELESDTRIRQHSLECQDCSRVVSLVVSGERDLRTLMAEHSSTKRAAQTAEAAIGRAKRRRVGIVMSGVFAILLAATIWVAWVRVVVPSARATADMTSNHQVVETLPLNCLSPQEAGELISPYVRSNGSLYYLPKSALQVITVRATAEEMTRVKSLLRQFDNAPAGSCAVNAPVVPR